MADWAMSADIKKHLVVLFLLTSSITCDDRPLLLTPYLDRNDSMTARKLSQVPQEGVFPNITLPPSYAGFFTVNKTLGNHMFFWMFPSTSLLPDAPLLLWLNGGPTVSSMHGLLWENGPVIGRGFPGHTVIGVNPYSWVGNFSMLYIDNPVGTGYSFSEAGSKGHRFLQEDYTRELFIFMEQFFVVYPEYQKRDFYIGGQSYAGKYVPNLAHYIHERKVRKLTQMPLTGVYLGGPYFNPYVESMAFSEYLYAVGAFSHAEMIKYKNSVESMNTKFREGKLEHTQLLNIISDLFPNTGLANNDNYVIHEEHGNMFIGMTMTSQKVREAVHVGANQLFDFDNKNLYSRFGPEFLDNTSDKMAELMDNYKVLVFTGDYDVIVSSVMVEAALLSLSWSGQAKYNVTSRSFWMVPEIGLIKGYYSQTDNFCRVVVHGAGHQTPRDQPEISLEMMLDFTRHGCINATKEDASFN